MKGDGAKGQFIALEAVPCGVIVVDARGTIVRANKRLARMFGYEPAELEGRALEMLLPERSKEAHALLRDVYIASPTERPMGEGRSLVGLRKDGTEAPIEIALSPGRAGSGGDVVAYVTDLSFHKQLEGERLRAVLAASRAFAEGIQDQAELARTIARTCVGFVGSFGSIQLLREDGQHVDVVASHHVDPALARDYAEYLEAAPPSRLGEGLSGRAIMTNQAIFLPRVDPATLVAGAAPQLQELVRRLAPRSLMVVPLRARGAVLGCIILAHGGERAPFSADELELLQMLADSAGLAIANARVFAHMVAAEAEVRALQAENARQTEIFRTMLRNTPRGAFFLVDRELRYLSAQGPSVSFLLGVPGDDVVGKRVEDVVPEKWRDEVLAALRATLAGETIQFEADRAGRTFEVRGAPIYTGAAQPTGALLHLYDVTERVTADAELRHERERFRAVVNNVPVGVFEFDARGDVRFANRLWFELLGRPEAEVRTREARSQWVHPDDLRGLAMPAPVTAGPFRLAFRYRGADGSLRHLSSQLAPLLAPDGALTGFIGTTEDVTTAHEAKERAARELREKETLLAEIHHRVKNNLQVIGSLINLQTDFVDDPNVRSVFDDVRNRIHAIALLHERLYRSTDLAEIDLADYLEGLAADVARATGADATGVEVTREGPPVKLDMDRAVPVGLLVNELVTNAFKHGRRGAAAPNVKIHLARSGDLARVSVTDDGPGFPEGVEPSRGRTLGVFLVKSLARQLRGKVTFAQPPTCCTLELALGETPP